MRNAMPFPLLLATALLTAAGPAYAGSAVVEPTCGTGDEPEQQLTLDWLQVPTDDSVTELPAGFLTLRFESTTDDPLRARIEVDIDAGGPDQRRVQLGAVAIPPRGRKQVDVHPQRLGLDLSNMRYSGKLFVNLQVQVHPPRDFPFDPTHPSTSEPPGEAGPDTPAPPRPPFPPGRTHPQNPRPVFAPPIYFHFDGGGDLIAYGEAALRREFAAGDLFGRGDVPPDETSTTLRVLEGGSGERRTGPKFEERIKTLDADHRDGPPIGPDEFTSTDPRICMKWEVGVTDKGQRIVAGNGQWVTEDWWSLSSGGLGDLTTAASPNFTVTARGVRVRLTQGGFDQTFDAHPATGCFVLPPEAPSGPMTMRVYAYSTDADGNVIRVVDGDEKTYSFVEQIDAPGPTEHRNFYVGDYTERATMAGISAFNSYRFHYGVSGKEMRISETGTCGGSGANNSSAHFDASGLPQGIARVRIHNGTGNASDGSGACSGSDHRRWKFLMGHEMGHAWLLLAIGRNTFEPNVPSDLTDECESNCDQGPGYGAESLEYNSLGVREGAAHFYATEVWNNHDSNTAVFTWFGKPIDVEYNDPHQSGGRLGNNCTTTKTCGKATIVDWLRFFWDWHTPFEPGPKPSGARIRDVYAGTVNAHFDEDDRLLAKDNYYFRMRQTMLEVVQSDVQKDDWADFASWNGTATNSFDGCGNPYGFPQCSCWQDRCDPLPSFCEGVPGCPCKDVDLNACPFGTTAPDGCRPDGPGSYESTPSFPSSGNGDGTYCIDDDDEAICSLASHAGKGVGVCRACPGAYGCSCFSDSDCNATGTSLAGKTIALQCWGASSQGWASGPGQCLPAIEDADGSLQSPALSDEREEFERTAWLCKQSCSSLEDTTNFDHECWYNQFQNLAFDYAACVDVGSCQDPDTLQFLVGGECELSGRRCDPDTLLCRPECDPLNNTGFGNPDCHIWGYPPSTICSTWSTPARCVPSECRDQPFAVDASECFQFTLGNL